MVHFESVQIDPEREQSGRMSMEQDLGCLMVGCQRMQIAGPKTSSHAMLDLVNHNDEDT